MTDHELQARLGKFEEELLGKVREISNHRRSWLYQNISTIVATLALLLALAVAWGSSQTQISHIQAMQQATSIRLENLDVRVRQHHENTDVHIDREWRGYVTRQLEDIRSLLTKHMARETR